MSQESRVSQESQASQESQESQASRESRAQPQGRSTPDEFFRTEMHVGRVVKAEEFPAARKAAYRLLIDFGPLGEKRSSAQITARYTPDELAGRLIIAVTNFPPRQIATFMSEVLVLGVPDDDGEVILLRPDADVAPGTRVF